MNILEVQDVTKQYSGHTAVDDVTFSVPKGCVFGLLGPNGAGKTSLIRIITGITEADKGTVVLDGGKLDGRDPLQIGYMPEERGLYKQMKVDELLIYLARLKGMSKADALKESNAWLGRLEISDWKKRKISELSKGMAQKIQFISTVMHKPKLLILDEPFSGLDPINANLIRDEIFQLKEQGTSIILSTHRMEQVEAFCDAIVMINKGKNVLEGTVSGIKERFKEHKYEIGFRNDIPDNLPSQGTVLEKRGNTLLFQANNEADANAFLGGIIRNGVEIRSFREVLPSVNEIFIMVAGAPVETENAA